VHIIAERTLQQLTEAHPEARAPLVTWAKVVRAVHWRTPHEVKTTFPATDFLAGGVAVFNLGGNKYRVSATVLYVNEKSRVGRVYIRHVMTHAEYDRRTRDGAL
jgi:mRNA interferase HigB